MSPNRGTSSTFSFETPKGSCFDECGNVKFKSEAPVTVGCNPDAETEAAPSILSRGTEDTLSTGEGAEVPQGMCDAESCEELIAETANGNEEELES